MQLNFTIKFKIVPVNLVRFDVYKTKDDTNLITQVYFSPPHINPRPVTINVPTTEVYLVQAYETPDMVSVGVLQSSFIQTPSLAAPRVLADIELEVGGAEEYDPAVGAGFVDIPGISEYSISRIVKIGYGPLQKSAYSVYPVTVDDVEYLRIELLGDDEYGDPIVFGAGEQFSVQFEPFLDSNVNVAISDLQNQIDDHIGDLDNPHQVTKNQVGLGNLPNAISNSYTLNDANTLATSAALYALAQSIINKIIISGKIAIGDIPEEKTVTVVHNQNIIGDYTVCGELNGIGPSETKDNDSIYITHGKTPNQFKVVLKELAGDIQNLVFYYTLIKH